MYIKYLKESFLDHCSKFKLKKDHEQILVIEKLVQFYENNSRKGSFLVRIFKKQHKKHGFYLHGDVGVGKTMILNFFYDYLDIPKQRTHFNEFMISVHDFLHKHRKNNKSGNLLDLFVKNIKQKTELIYFDEFQVTNIVDAMILGKLFETIFNNNIKAIFSSNTKIQDLYKDGLQREQFLPFIKTIEDYCVEHELIINEDYRKSGIKTLERLFHPNNEKITFQINQLFREITKGKELSIKTITVKGRNFLINKYYQGVARFDFKELCAENLWAEDYLFIVKQCSLIVIDNIPNFNDENVNEQQRFITLIDIIYEKKIPMMVTCEVSLDNFGSSTKLSQVFKRTLSRLYELTSPEVKIV